jgi:phospholipase C
MLENRSFDHMLGFSGITGTSAATGKPAAIDGLKGNESNEYRGHKYLVSVGAPDVATHGPGHEFADVVEQLYGEGVVYRSGGDQPRVTNGGYVASFARVNPDSPGDVMKCFAPSQLPVLNALVREFCVCDRWFSSMPGPTWPNRMFAHAGSSAGFDDSPGETHEAEWELTGGVKFAGGNLFDHLKAAGVKYRIYADDDFPNVAELENISVYSDVREFEDLADDLKDPHFDASYVWIEPSYDVLDHFRDGNSQHPLGSVAAGEAIIKATYEAIRNSPVWEKSLLIITWDEHGGFYDHVTPGAASANGFSPGSKHGFLFDHLGVRVPAVIVSPLIPKNLIEHRPFEHSSIPATVQRIFGIPALGKRDDRANAANMLATLKTARTDTPRTLPDAPGGARRLSRLALTGKPVARPDEHIASDTHGNLQATLRTAFYQHLRLTPVAQRPALVARFRAIQTRGQAAEYLQEVSRIVRQKRTELKAAR